MELLCQLSYNGVSDVGCRISDVGFRMSDFGCRISDVGFRMSDFGCRMSNINFKKRYPLIIIVMRYAIYNSSIFFLNSANF
ncbi:hypothetical protein L6307_00690 [Candidatus Parcubacteria bacterium]|nr:hypothetical protein [Patescibacteria group bacterium]MCG2697604.1 hypothetical protein [Candidatus Parcubacteria bacterium]